MDGEGAEDWEYGEGAGWFFNWAGTLGVTLLASEALLAWLGIVATSSAVFGPAGWLVSGGLLLGGLLLKKWCEKRAVAELRRAVTDALRTVRRDVLNKLRSAESGLLDLAEEVRQALDEEMSQLRWQLEQIRQDRSRSESERQQIRQELRQCESHLKKTESNALEVINSCLKS
jgi:chromosome segregation ATPase